eukprot:PhF_6_TR22674/c0_g1_i1/m.32286/K14379/ACP5; tartrate-resistant acid phosphatase type 5
MIIALSLFVFSLMFEGLKSEQCFLSYGCWGGANKDTQSRVAGIMGRVASSHPVKFVVGAGDNFYKKGVKSVDDERFQETFESVYNHESLKSLKFFQSLGNHDYRGNFLAQVNYTLRSKRWYMPATYYFEDVTKYFDHGVSVLLIVLDTPLMERCANNGDASPRCWDHGHQRVWLAKVLEEQKHVPWKIVVGHYPIHANGPHVNHKWLQQWLKPLFQKYKVSLYLNADNHYVQACEDQGTWFINTGGGAGYLPHKPSDKGYKVDPTSKYLHLGDGPVLHCFSDQGNSLQHTIVDGKSGGSVHSWTVQVPDVPPAVLTTMDDSQQTKEILVVETKLYSHPAKVEIKQETNRLNNLPTPSTPNPQDAVTYGVCVVGGICLIVVITSCRSKKGPRRSV